MTTEQVRQFQAGELSTEPQPFTEAATFTGEVRMVSRSFKLPLSVFLDLTDYAVSTGRPWSAVAREFVIAGLAAARAAGGTTDPATALHAIINEAERALSAVERRAA